MSRTQNGVEEAMTSHSHSWLKHHVQQLEMDQILGVQSWACGQGEESTFEPLCTAMDQSAAECAQARRLNTCDAPAEQLVSRTFLEAWALEVHLEVHKLR
jgi:hypothetical protein